MVISVAVIVVLLPWNYISSVVFEMDCVVAILAGFWYRIHFVVHRQHPSTSLGSLESPSSLILVNVQVQVLRTVR